MSKKYHTRYTRQNYSVLTLKKIISIEFGFSNLYTLKIKNTISILMSNEIKNNDFHVYCHECLKYNQNDDLPFYFINNYFVCFECYGDIMFNQVIERFKNLN